MRMFELIKNIMKVNGFTVETPEAQKCQVDRSKLEDKAFIQPYIASSPM